MSPPQVTGIGSAPSVLGRLPGSRPSGPEGVEPRRSRPFRAADLRVLGAPSPAAESLAPPAPPLWRATGSVLAAGQFQSFLERERCLADRGTRRFSLLVLRRRPGAKNVRASRDALGTLARQLIERLRSTDLVGRLDPDRVEVLLADTEPTGAQVVADWIEQAEARLALDLEQTIYVYPSVVERSSESGLDEPSDTPSGWPTGGATGSPPLPSAADKSAANGKAHGGPEGAPPPFPTHAAAVRVDALRRGKRWPMEDLWPLLDLPTPPWKRLLDIVVAGLALLVLLPLFALIALAIRLDSPGPVIFRQLRAGRGARPFVFYKFRSMSADAEAQRAALVAHNEQDGPIFKIRADPRITRLGSLLRRWSLDELPQLWNVLKGDISLVGPRSPTFDEVGKYERWQRRRLCVTGGLTCFWQVSGRSHIPFRDWMRLDMRYVACRNLWLDLKLLALTLPAVISGRGAC